MSMNETQGAPAPAGQDALTKRDLVIRIAHETGLNQQEVHEVIQRALDYITEALQQGMHVEFRDFGVFQVTLRKSRIGRNPNKPADVVRIPPRKVVKFKPGRKMKQIMLESAPEAVK
ncbi:MAG: HU family DNA-binding protein [bacterium]